MYTIPFDSETLKSIITGDINSPELDYANSKIKGKNFITYLSNLKYENLVIDFSNISFEEKCDLISEFIKHNSTCHIEQLEATVVKCLFFYRDYDLSLVDNSEDDKTFLSKSIITNQEIEKFVIDNKDLIKQLSDLLDGVLLYAIKNLNAYKEELGDFVTTNIVAEKQEIGKTFVNLFENPTFNCHYYSSLPKFDDLKYFDHYFDRPIYSGKTLINFITSPKCVIFPLLKMIIDVQYTPEQLQTISEQLDATPI
jgi:hypothetical protein